MAFTIKQVSTATEYWTEQASIALKLSEENKSKFQRVFFQNLTELAFRRNLVCSDKDINVHVNYDYDEFAAANNDPNTTVCIMNDPLNFAMMAINQRFFPTHIHMDIQLGDTIRVTNHDDKNVATRTKIMKIESSDPVERNSITWELSEDTVELMNELERAKTVAGLARLHHPYPVSASLREIPATGAQVLYNYERTQISGQATSAASFCNIDQSTQEKRSPKHG